MHFYEPFYFLVRSYEVFCKFSMAGVFAYDDKKTDITLYHC